MEGTQLGTYTLIEKLGGGGMGDVYRARDAKMERDVAIKLMRQELVDSPEFLQRFEREKRLAAQLNHPHICRLYDVGCKDRYHYLVMEYLDGETIASWLSRQTFGVSETVHYGIQIADALWHAHHKGICHRDLKPANIMITESGAKVMDLGLAKRNGMGTAGGQTVTAPITMRASDIGTPAYMAPETWKGKPADVRSDLFAFGVVLYEMLTGRKAFDGQDRTGLERAILTSEPPAISRSLHVPVSLERLIKVCMIKDPDTRLQSARDAEIILGWIAEAIRSRR